MKNQLEQLVLTDEETLSEVVNCLAEHIPINSTGAGDPQNLCRIRTTTKKRMRPRAADRRKGTRTKQPTLRLLFVGISFLLVNIWVNLLWRKISKPVTWRKINLSYSFSSKTNAFFLKSSC